MLKKSWGKYYSTRFVQRIKYDKEGRILEDKTIKKRRTKKQKELDSGKKKLVRFVQKETFLIQYQRGLKVLESKTIGGLEYARVVWQYKDTTMTSQKKYLRGKVLEETSWTYNDQNVLLNKKIQKYDTNGQPRSYTIVSYNAKKQAFKEELYLQNKVYKTTKRTFDKQGNLLEETLSSANNPSFEKTTYIYKYY